MEAGTGSPHINAFDASTVGETCNAQANERISSADSLVTVSLSGIESPRDTHSPETFVVQTENERQSTCIEEPIHTPVTHARTDVVNGEVTNLQDERECVSRPRRASTTSMLGIEEEPHSDAAPAMARSRSNSSGTFSSTESVHLDWDELEKNESQALRDEGSDEVNMMYPSA